MHALWSSSLQYFHRWSDFRSFPVYYCHSVNVMRVSARAVNKIFTTDYYQLNFSSRCAIFLFLSFALMFLSKSIWMCYTCIYCICAESHQKSAFNRALMIAFWILKFPFIFHLFTLFYYRFLLLHFSLVWVCARKKFSFLCTSFYCDTITSLVSARYSYCLVSCVFMCTKKLLVLFRFALSLLQVLYDRALSTLKRN